MQSLRGRAGYTLIELVIVLSIIGIMATMAVAALRGYTRRENTRQAARTTASTLDFARSQAMTMGRMTWVVFKQPANGIAPFAPDQVAAIIVDSDNDLQPTAADSVTPVRASQAVRENTAWFASGASPYGSTALPAEDPKNGGGNILDDTVDGATLDVDVNLAAPAIGFDPQGFPVTVSQPLKPGGGAGGLYITDNDSSVVAVLVLPLGEVRTMAYDAGSNEWK